MLRSVIAKSGLAMAVAGFLAGTAVTAFAADDHAAQTAASRKAVEGFARLLYIEHKPKEASARYFAPDLIQHDAEIADGSHGDDAFLENRRKKNPEKYLETSQYSTVVDNIFADGDLVAVKSHMYTNPKDRGRVFVDIWRVKDGKFVEHWDVIQPVYENPKNDNTMYCGTATTYDEGLKAGDTVKNPTCGPSGPASARADTIATVEAYRKLLDKPGGAVEASEKYISEDYVQHSPHIAPGRDAVAPYFLSVAAARKAAGMKATMGRMIADGNFVLYHRLVTTNDNPRGIAYADLFQVKDGLIVAHWDVIQPVPPFSVNGHSMVVGPLEPGRKKGFPDE